MFSSLLFIILLDVWFRKSNTHKYKLDRSTVYSIVLKIKIKYINIDDHSRTEMSFIISN
jgi:hypothetical protein